jgi:C1A family cysteine protease
MTIAAMTTGTIPMPNTKREQLMGGHAICLTGYNDTTSLFTFTNSWGTYTGISGRFTIPYNYVGSSALAGEYFQF